MSERDIVREASPRYGSDVLAELLAQLGVEYAGFNPGASFRGLHDSLVNYQTSRPIQTILCTHEEISVALAHGYAKATGRPMVAALHDVVGLQHASMAIFNAWCDRVPVLLLGGSGPQDSSLRRPWIEWIHTALVQGTLVRDYVKWDDQPVSVQGAIESILRGWRLMRAEPAAPVYIALDVTVQEERAPDTVSVPADLERWTEQAPVQASPAGLETLAGWLTAARRPLILADRVGRSPEAVAALHELAELVEAPVVDLWNRFNFPNTHPLDAAESPGTLLRDADLVLALDVVDLYGVLWTTDANNVPQEFALAPDAKLATLSVSELLVRSWTADYQRIVPVDLNLVGETRLALPALVELVRERVATASGRAAADDRETRAARLGVAAVDLRARWEAEARAGADAAPISTAYLALALREALENRAWVFANSHLRGWARRILPFDRTEQWTGSAGGAGVGYGIGAALGVGLAYRGTDTIVVNVQPDGDLLYCTSALWTAASERLPVLTIMWNNRSYYNSEAHAERIARFRGRDADRRGIGTRPESPLVDFATVARGFGMAAEGPIESPRELPAALARGVRAVSEGRPYLLDVVTGVR
ncbi:MAG TPA: thiamine pyrophosphate-binding protein [Chloroflexota bacterium]|nr:thiamine pyrophosphate-binding protein [Chloroflexota bacterium]